MEVLENIPLAQFTTFKIGGTAKYFFKPSSTKEFYEAILFLKNKSLPYFILGCGSNVLIGSKDFNGGVISTLNLNEIKLNDNQITCGAGVINTDLSDFAYEKSIKDFEFLYYMPGSIGGSTVMNARAFNGSMSDVIISVSGIEDGETKEWSLEDIHFGYKKSIFQERDIIITEVLFKADKGIKEEIKDKMESNKTKRLSTKQYDFPSAGCVFKNVYSTGIPTGKLVDDLGLKGQSIGDAEIYTLHGNFIINKGNATSDDVIQLINKIKQEVKTHNNIDLECEIKLLGNI